MTREEIREVIDTYTDDVCLFPDKDCVLQSSVYCLSDEEAYKCLMKRLGELGVVIKVDRELPVFEKQKLAEKHDWYGQGLFDMYMDLLNDGFINAVEPLIGG